MRLEILGESHGDLALASFSVKDMVPLTSSSAHHRVRWRHGRNLTGLVGQTVRLRFFLESASLCAFQVLS